MNFENFNIIYILASLFCTLIICIYYFKYNRLLQIFSLKKEKSTSELIVSVFMYVFILISLLGPQYGYKLQKIKKVGADIVIALDVSKSMLAKDIHPSRLARAKRWIEKFSKTTQGDRIGLVSFSGVSFIESPLTLDTKTFIEFVKNSNPESTPVDGTDIELALIKSIQLLDYTDTSKQKRDTAIILITDGENFSKDLTDISAKLTEKNTKLFILGVGTKKGAKIPSKYGFKSSIGGKSVISRLNEETLKSLAESANGEYFNLESLNFTMKELYEKKIKNVLFDTELENGSQKVWNNRFQLSLFIAILLFLVRFVVYRR